MEGGRQSRKQSINKIESQTEITDHLQVPEEATMTRKRSSGRSIENKETSKPEKMQFLRLIELKEQLLAIRERKAVIPTVPDPQIVDFFNDMKLAKQRQITKTRLIERIKEKKKQLHKLKQLYTQSQQKFEQKSQIFRQKSALLRVLATKMQNQLSKTKDRYRQVQFNKVIVQGIRKVLYYRLAEMLFNLNTRNIFNVLSNLKMHEQKADEDSIGISLGYLGLFMSIVGAISGARMWIGFTFRGPKSTIRATDGTILLLHPRETRLSEALKLLNEQLFQLMRDTMQLKVQNPQNFYQLCEQLSKQILTIK